MRARTKHRGLVTTTTKSHFVIVTLFRCSLPEYKCLFCEIPTGQTQTSYHAVRRRSILSPHFPHHITIRFGCLSYAYYKILLTPSFQSHFFGCSLSTAKQTIETALKNIINGRSFPNTIFSSCGGRFTSVHRMIQK